MNKNFNGPVVATLHREEVLRRVVRRIANVLELDDFGERLDLSHIQDSASWELDVFRIGCKQLGVYVKQLESLTDIQALDIVCEGHVIVIPKKDGDYTILERKLGRKVEITSVDGSHTHRTVPQSEIAGLLADSESGVFMRTAAESNIVVAVQAVEQQKRSGESMTMSLEQDFKAAREKWEQSRNAVVALQADLDDKRNKLRIAEEVAEKGLVSREEVFSKQQAVEAQRANVLKAENAVHESYAVLLSKEKEIESKMEEIALKNRSAEQKALEATQKLNSIEKELIDLETKRGELDRLEIRSPRSGLIQQWFGVTGSDTVKEGDQLFVIVPEAAELAVEMKVTGNDMPLINEGDRVRLQFEGWPAVQFVGWPSVAVGTFGGKVNRVFPTDDGKGNFRILVSPDKTTESDSGWPDDRYLRQGVRANGWVLLKRVPLGYEIWRQLNGFPPTVADEEPENSKKKSGKVKLPKA